jgi:rhodanese-related sulfurtransferase
MYKTIDREELKKKMENKEDVVLIEVLGEEDYSKEHIKGAINIPLKNIGLEANKRFDKSKEIVVYCSDKNCGASPAAAEKLDSLGFENVYDYVEGKQGWKEAGLPME